VSLALVIELALVPGGGTEISIIHRMSLTGRVDHDLIGASGFAWKRIVTLEKHRHEF
jgi:hypothetical protein